MEHRHLNHTRYTPAALDDVIARGGRQDWEALRRAVLADHALARSIRAVCEPRLADPYAQRYHFWTHYVTERFA
jgi:hypothetical protein